MSDHQRLRHLLSERFVPGEMDVLAAVLGLPACDDAAKLLAAAVRAELVAPLQALIERHRPAIAGSFAAVHYVQGGVPLPVVAADRRHRVEFHATEELPGGRLAYGGRIVGPKLNLVLVPRRLTGRATWAPDGSMVELELWRVETRGEEASVPVAADEGLRLDLQDRRVAHRSAGAARGSLQWVPFAGARAWIVDTTPVTP